MKKLQKQSDMGGQKMKANKIQLHVFDVKDIAGQQEKEGRRSKAAGLEDLHTRLSTLVSDDHLHHYQDY